MREDVAVITDGIHRLTTEQATYLLDLTVGTLTLLPSPVGSPREHPVEEFETWAVESPVDLAIGQRLPIDLGVPDQTPLVALDELTV